MKIRSCNLQTCKDSTGNCSIPGADGLPVQCVGAWVEDKYFFLEQYLNASCEARRKFADKGNAVFIDLFNKLRGYFMRKTYICILFLFLALTMNNSKVKAQINGFSLVFPDGTIHSLKFGASYDQVKTQLKSRFLDRQVFSFGPGSDSYRKLIILDDFKLGNKFNRVYFFFDHNGQLYKFNFNTIHRTADYLEPFVYEDGAYLNVIFTRKYGNPHKCYKNPNILGIKDNYITKLCIWKLKGLNVFTGYSTESLEYFAVGSVSSKKMERKYNLFIKNKKTSSAEKAATQF